MANARMALPAWTPLLWGALFLPLLAGNAAAGMAIGGAGAPAVAGTLGWLAVLSVLPAFFPAHPAAGRRILEATGLLVACLIAGWAGEPWLDDDLYRYLWDGFVTSQGGDPLRQLPSSPAEGFPEAIRARIGYADTPTVYPPLAQLLFAALWELFGASPRGWTLAFAGVTAGTLMLMGAVADRWGAPARVRHLLLFNPLFIREFANSGHVDIAGLFLVAAALLVLGGGPDRWRAIVAGLGLGAAALVKPLALVIAPFLPGLDLRPKIVLVAVAGITALAGTASYFPRAESLGFYLEMLRYFQQHWIFAPALTDPLQQVVAHSRPHLSEAESWYAALKVAAALSATVLAIGLTRQLRGTAMRVGGIAPVGLFLLLQGAVNVWYTFWLWPLILMQPWRHRAQESARTCWPWLFLPLAAAVAGYPYWASLEDWPWLRRLSWGLWILLFLPRFSPLQWRNADREDRADSPRWNRPDRSRPR